MHSPINYQTYWSILDVPSNSIKSYTVALVITITCIVIGGLIRKLMRKDAENLLLQWVFGLTALISFSLFIYLKFFTIDTTAERINKLLNSPYVGIVEGEITDFNRSVVQKRYGSVTFESFQIDSISFTYDDYLMGKFNRFSNTNDILRNGLFVRITYTKSNHSIQKIEIAQEFVQNKH